MGVSLLAFGHSFILSDSISSLVSTSKFFILAGLPCPPIGFFSGLFSEAWLLARCLGLGWGMPLAIWPLRRLAGDGLKLIDLDDAIGDLGLYMIRFY